MQRCSNWPAKLALFIEEKRTQPFDWAQNNCCFFASDWIVTLIGFDPAAEFRGKVDSALSAARILKQHGGVDEMATRACARHGWPEVPPAYARRGDWVLVQTEHGPALGVCHGGQSVFAGPDCIARSDTLSALRTWRIG